MNRESLVEVIPHYLALLILVILTLTVVRTAFGELAFWIEFAIVVVVAFAYRPIVMRLGIGPSAWER